VAGFALSGIYTLVDRERNNAQFQAFCDMRTDGGGWMLSFKQVNHASGGVAFDAGLFGTVSSCTSATMVLRPHAVALVCSLSGYRRGASASHAVQRVHHGLPHRLRQAQADAV